MDRFQAFWEVGARICGLPDRSVGVDAASSFIPKAMGASGDLSRIRLLGFSWTSVQGRRRKLTRVSLLGRAAPAVARNLIDLPRMAWFGEAGGERVSWRHGRSPESQAALHHHRRSERCMKDHVRKDVPGT